MWATCSVAVRSGLDGVFEVRVCIQSRQVFYFHEDDYSTQLRTLEMRSRLSWE